MNAVEIAMARTCDCGQSRVQPEQRLQCEACVLRAHATTLSAELAMVRERVTYALSALGAFDGEWPDDLQRLVLELCALASVNAHGFEKMADALDVANVVCAGLTAKMEQVREIVDAERATGDAGTSVVLARLEAVLG